MTEKIKVMIPEEDVAKRIEEIGKRISEDYAGKQVHMICVLKGGVFFMCELAKRITVPVSMDFMSVKQLRRRHVFPAGWSRSQRIWMNPWRERMSW